MDLLGWHRLRSCLDHPERRVIADLREFLHPHDAPEDPTWWAPTGATGVRELFDRLGWMEGRWCAHIARELLVHDWWQRIGHTTPDVAHDVFHALTLQRDALLDRADWLDAWGETMLATRHLPVEAEVDVPFAWTLEGFLRHPSQVFGVLPGHAPPATFLERWWELCRARLPLRTVLDGGTSLDLPIHSLFVAANCSERTIRQFAMEVLCEHPVPEAVDLYARALRRMLTPSVRTRREAVAEDVLQALRRLGAEAASTLPLLLDLYQQDQHDPWVMVLLHEAIIDVGQHAIPDILRALARGDWAHRRNLARILGAMGAAAASTIPFLEKLAAHDASNKVRTAAATALQDIRRAR